MDFLKPIKKDENLNFFEQNQCVFNKKTGKMIASIKSGRNNFGLLGDLKESSWVDYFETGARCCSVKAGKYTYEFYNNDGKRIANMESHFGGNPDYLWLSVLETGVVSNEYYGMQLVYRFSSYDGSRTYYATDFDEIVKRESGEKNCQRKKDEPCL